MYIYMGVVVTGQVVVDLQYNVLKFQVELVNGMNMYNGEVLR